MVNELMDRLVLEKKYQLQELYNLIEDYCLENNIEDWKHKVRAMLEEKNGTRLGAAAPNFLYEKSRRRRIPRPLYGQDIKTAELSRI